MTLYDFLVGPLVADPQLQRRLASAAAANVRWDRRMLTQGEFHVARAASSIRRFDVAWAGHLPVEIAADMGDRVRLGRIVLGRKDRREAFTLGQQFIPVGGISARLRWSIRERRPVPEAVVERWSVQIERSLRKSHTAVVVLTANYDPGMRLVAHAARRAGIAVALYGHGISSPKYYLGMDEGISSHYLCWYEEEAAEYVALGTDPERVAVSGPLRARQDTAQRPSAIRDVLLLGSRSQGPGYMEFLERTFREFEENGLRLAYRPHPLEDLVNVRATIPAALILDAREDLSIQVSQSTWVVGGSTTALIEAKLDGACTCFVRNLYAVSSPSIDAHLSRTASRVESCQTFDAAGWKVPCDDAESSYKHPPVEIPRLMNSGWFRAAW